MLTPNTTRIPSTSSHDIPHRHRTFIASAFGLLMVVGLCVPSAHAQIPLPDARVIEWDGPLMGDDVEPGVADPMPGALAVDNGRVWYVTRVGVQRLVRFTPGSPLDTAAATFNWWILSPATVTTGGLRLRPADTIAYIRTATDLQRVDTVSNTVTRYIDGLVSLSDVAVGSAGNTVFVTGAVPDADECIIATPQIVCIGDDPTPFVVQRMVFDSDGDVTITRWNVGGGAGSVYLSGIDVSPTNGQLVYFSLPDTNEIGELNTQTGAIRRWSLDVPSIEPVAQPRQLDIAMGGFVWVVTGSGHIVRLNPTTGEILAAPIPPLGASFLNNPFGLDADGVIGFTTDGGPGFNKVGMLFPDGETVSVTPIPDSDVPTIIDLCAPIADEPNPACEGAETTQQTAQALPVIKHAQAMETETTGGTFFEALIDTGVPENPSDSSSPSTQPLGIANDPSGPLGTYYSAIGGSVNRIAHVSIPVQATGLVSGGGWITTATTDPLTGATVTSSKGTFGLVAMRKREGDPVKGHVTYQNHDNDDRVISMQLTDLFFVDNHAEIGGVCKTGSDCMTFRVDVSDNGQPHSTPRDTFEIARDPIVPGTLGMPGAVDGGPLNGGNVKIHRQR